MVSLADAAFRLRRNSYPGYDGEGGRRVGGWWNSKGVPVLYMSENRWLAVLEVLVHLSGTLPDECLLGAADIPEDVAIERIARLARGTVDIKSS
jgi:RES domain-containing protein